MSSPSPPKRTRLNNIVATTAGKHYFKQASRASRFERNGQCPLLELPEELILNIIDHLDSQTRKKVARTCLRFQSMAEPTLYRHVFMRTKTDVARLEQSLDDGPHREQAVLSLDMRCRYGYFTAGPELEEPRLFNVLRRLRNLQVLTFESPYTANASARYRGHWETIAQGLLRLLEESANRLAYEGCPQASLPFLRKLTLHLNGIDGRFWDVDRAWACLFCHPTLIELTLSYAHVNEEIAISIHTDLIGTTPLRGLVLEECNIDQAGLRAVLSMPKGLERLTLREAQHQEGDNKTALTDEPVLLFDSLAKQSGSLTYFCHIPRNDARASPYTRPANPRWSFASFNRLTDLHLEGEHTTYLHNALLSRSTAPPNLRCLKLFGDSICYTNLGPAATLTVDRSTKLFEVLSSLEKLDLHFTGALGFRGRKRIDKSLRDELHRINGLCRQRNIWFNAFVSFYPSTRRYNEPMLYGTKPHRLDLLLGGRTGRCYFEVYDS